MGKGKSPDRGGIRVKVYLVLRRENTVKDTQAHERIVAAALTRASAEVIQGDHVGSYIHKVIATK